MTLSADAILHEDPHLLVVNKPCGVLTQAPVGLPSVAELAREYIRVKYAKPAGVYLAVSHRLDRPVSGVLLFCRNTKAAQRIQAQFEARTVAKTYWALVPGIPGECEFTWSDQLRKLPDEAHVVRAAAHEPGAKLAVLQGRILGRAANGAAHLELQPSTGRTHQLRVQCAWRGLPILGDEQYGSAVAFGPPAELLRDRWIALHARRLEFDHPFTKRRLSIVAPLPPAWPEVECTA